MAKERILKEFKIPKRPINEMFLSINGNPEDFAFRGVKDSWRENWDELKEKIAEYEEEMRHAPKYVNDTYPM